MRPMLAVESTSRQAGGVYIGMAPPNEGVGGQAARTLTGGVVGLSGDEAIVYYNHEIKISRECAVLDLCLPLDVIKSLS